MSSTPASTPSAAPSPSAGTAAVALPRRPLGGTGLSVSILGFGGSPLGGVFEDVPEDVAIASVHEAFRLGINYFDTSPYYAATKVGRGLGAFLGPEQLFSSTSITSLHLSCPIIAHARPPPSAPLRPQRNAFQSETVLGKALATLPRADIVVASKVGRYGPNPEDFDFSAERVERSVRESLSRLQVDYIDVVACHDVEFGDLEQVRTGALPALARLKAEGVVRHVGVTGLPLGCLRQVLSEAPAGSVDTVLSYCRWCLCDRALEGELDGWAAAGLGIVNASPLSMGLLTPGGPPSWHPAPEPLQRACRAAAARCAQLGVSLPKLALKWALTADARVATTLVGMCRPDQVRENVATAIEAFRGVEGGEEAEEATALAEVEALLAPVLGTTWPSGRPENDIK